MSETPQTQSIANGPAAAAILSAGIGSFVLGVIAFIADAHKPLGKALAFYLPTGPLSGISTLGIAAWLVSWVALSLRWRKKSVALRSVTGVAIALLLLAVLLCFPPLEDLLQGK